MPAQRYHADQLEFAFAPKFTADVKVECGEDGRTSMTVTTSPQAWVSTAEAALILGRSAPWVRERLESGWLRGRRIGRNWEVDANHCEERKRQARNW
jgi:hypothetical protein